MPKARYVRIKPGKYLQDERLLSGRDMQHILHVRSNADGTSEIEVTTIYSEDNRETTLRTVVFSDDGYLVAGAVEQE